MKGVSAVLCVLLSAGLCWAQEEPAPEGGGEQEKKTGTTIASARPSYGGLGGFGVMVTPEVVGEGELGFRGGVGFQHQNLEINERVGGGTARFELRAQTYTLQGAVGLMDMIEVSLSVPIVDYELKGNISGVGDQDLGFGNPQLGVKLRAPIDLEFISLALYSTVQPPWGEADVVQPRRLLEDEEFAEWELGTSIGVHAGLVHGYMNLAFALYERGIQSFRYRFGVALRPVEIFELGIYYDGEEFEGSVRSNGWFGANATVFFKPLYVGAGVEGLVLDNGFDDVTTSGAKDEVSGWRLTFYVGAAF